MTHANAPEGGAAGSIVAVRIMAVTIPVIFAVAMIDRLIPPVSMVTIMAMLSSPSSGS